MGRDSSIGIATRYGLEGPGIESWWGGREFPHLSRPALRPTQPPVQRVPDLFPGVKRPGRDTDHPPPSSPEIKERVELYFCPPFLAFVACSRDNFYLSRYFSDLKTRTYVFQSLFLIFKFQYSQCYYHLCSSNDPCSWYY